MFKHYKIVNALRQEWIDHLISTEYNPSGQDFDINLELGNRYSYNREVYDKCHLIKFKTIDGFRIKLERIKWRILCLRYKKIDKILKNFSKNA